MCIIEPMYLRGVDLKLLVSLYKRVAGHKSSYGENVMAPLALCSRIAGFS
jgi:hypothetical protein